MRIGPRVVAILFASTALGAVGCSNAPRPAEVGILPRSEAVAPCAGDAWVDVNNTGSIPVDLYVAYSAGNDAMLGTVPPGRTRIGLTRTPISGFAVREVGKRTILEATTAPHPGTDRVFYTPGCKSDRVATG